MAERPIILRPHEVRGVLAGRQTQVRRMVTPENIRLFMGDSAGSRKPTAELLAAAFEWAQYFRRFEGVQIWLAKAFAHQAPAMLTQWQAHSTYGFPGDLLWVRETWAHYHTVNGVARSGGRAFSEVSDGLVGYRANGHDTIEDFRSHVRLMSGCDLEAVEIKGNRWRPSIHMPRWASRLTLRVTDVRIERLNDISEADAIAEGAEAGDDDSEARGLWGFDATGWYRDPREAYHALWEHLHGPGSWIENPFVWAVSFEPVPQPQAKGAEQ